MKIVIQKYFFYSMSKLMFTSKRSWGQRKGAGPNVPRKGPSGHWRKKGPLGHQRRTGPREHLTVRWLVKSSGMYGVLKQTLTTNSRLWMKTLNIGHVSICVLIIQWNLCNPSLCYLMLMFILIWPFSNPLHCIQSNTVHFNKSSLPVHVRLDSYLLFVFYLCICPCFVDFLYLLHVYGRSISLF